MSHASLASDASSIQISPQNIRASQFRESRLSQTHTLDENIGGLITLLQ